MTTSVSDFLAKIVVGDADLDRLHGAVNDSPGTYTDATGNIVDNLRKRLEDVGYKVPVAFTAGLAPQDGTFTVSHNGSHYAANPASIPFTTTATFDSGQWLALNLSTEGFVASSGDTMTGDLVLQDETDTDDGRGIVFEKSRTATAPLDGDVFGALYMRSKDPENGGSSRTRKLMNAEATEDHDHVTETFGAKGQLLHNTRGGNSTNDVSAEWDEDGFRVRANGSARFMNGVSMPLGWGVTEGNTPTDNKSAFDAFEAQISGQVADLGSETLSVPAGQVPSANKYQSGYLKEVGAQGNVDLNYAQMNTLLKVTTPLTHGKCNSIWGQDNACWDDGMREGFIAFSENNAHGVADGSARVVTMRSRDGLSWTREVMDFGFPCVVFGHTVYGGFQMFIVRDESGGANDGKFYLYGRQLAQRVELNRLRATYGVDNRYHFTQFDLVDSGRPLMLYESATVEFNGLPSDLGGQNLNAEDNVAYRDGSTFLFRANSNFTGNWDYSGTFEMNVRESDLFHITLDGGETIGEAIESAGGGTGEPTIIQGIQMWRPGFIDGSGNDYASRGDILVGVSGGQFNAAVAKIVNAMDENNKGSVEYVREIAGADTQLSEVTVVMQGQDTDDVFGFIRTQDANDGQTVPAAFFHTNDDFVTTTLTNLPTGAFEDSPIPACILGDDIVACASLDRGGNGQRGERQMVILKASVTDAIATGAAAFAKNIIPVEKGEYKNQTLTGGATGFGVPSITSWGSGTDKTVAMFWTQEANTNDPYRLDTVTQMMATKVGFDPNPMAYFGAEQIAWGSVPRQEWSLALRGAPATDDDATIIWNNVDSQSAPHGYDETTGVLTFPVSGIYSVSCQLSYEPNTGSNYVTLRNEDDDAYVTEHEKWLAGTPGGGTAQSMGFSDTTVKVKAGDTMVFKVNATGGTTNSNARNFAGVKLIEAF